MKRQIVGAFAAFALSGAVLTGLAGTAEATPSAPDCTPRAAVPAVAEVSHTDFQYKDWVPTGLFSGHFDYRWSHKDVGPISIYDWKTWARTGVTQKHIEVAAVAAVPAFNPTVSYVEPTVSDAGVVNFGASSCGTWKVGSKVHLDDASGFKTHDGTEIQGGATRFRLVFTPNAGLHLPSNTLPGDGFKVGESAVFHVYVADPIGTTKIWAGFGSGHLYNGTINGCNGKFDATGTTNGATGSYAETVTGNYNKATGALSLTSVYDVDTNGVIDDSTGVNNSAYSYTLTGTVVNNWVTGSYTVTKTPVGGSSVTSDPIPFSGQSVWFESNVANCV